MVARSRQPPLNTISNINVVLLLGDGLRRVAVWCGYLVCALLAVGLGLVSGSYGLCIVVACTVHLCFPVFPILPLLTLSNDLSNLKTTSLSKGTTSLSLSRNDLSLSLSLETTSLSLETTSLSLSETTSLAHSRNVCRL